jgi:hypothetical protein
MRPPIAGLKFASFFTGIVERDLIDLSDQDSPFRARPGTYSPMSTGTDPPSRARLLQRWSSPHSEGLRPEERMWTRDPDRAGLQIAGRHRPSSLVELHLSGHSETSEQTLADEPCSSIVSELTSSRLGRTHQLNDPETDCGSTAVAAASCWRPSSARRRSVRNRPPRCR